MRQGVAGIRPGRVDEMQEDRAALDVTEETVTEPGSPMRPLDQARMSAITSSPSPASATPRCGASVVNG